MAELIKKLLSSFLLATSVGVTLVLLFVGYEVALMIMGGGYGSGQVSMVLLGTLPSLFALLSAPFWLTLQRMRRQGA